MRTVTMSPVLPVKLYVPYTLSASITPLALSPALIGVWPESSVEALLRTVPGSIPLSLCSACPEAVRTKLDRNS